MYTLLMEETQQHNAATDVAVGQRLRDLNSKLIWVDDPNNAGERIQIIVERRANVVRLLEEHLNRNGGNHHMVADLGAPAPEAPAPVRRGGRRRSFD